MRNMTNERFFIENAGDEIEREVSHPITSCMTCRAQRGLIFNQNVRLSENSNEQLIKKFALTAS
jgi:sulfur relay (sulfurtransferase) complex TusBCD TusD component (DsrE family)